MLFWLGVGYYSINITVSTSVTFLLIDRIFIVSWPKYYHQNRNRFLFLTIFGTAIVGLSMLSFIFVLEWATVDTLTECYSLVCLSKWKYTTTIALSFRLLVGLLNGVLALILEIILHRYTRSLSSQKQFKRANFLTITLAITELLLIFTPNLIFVICFTLGIDHWSKIGPYSVDFHGLNALLTALIYRFVISSSVTSVEAVNSDIQTN